MHQYAGTPDSICRGDPEEAVKRMEEHLLLHHDDTKAVNTEDNPTNVAPKAGPGGTVEGGRAQIAIPGLSWNVLRFVPQK